MARSQEAATTPTRAEITVGADPRMAQGVTGRGPFFFAFSRPLLPTDGTLAVVVDDVDLAAFASVEGTGLRLASHEAHVASGAREFVFLLLASGTWHEIGRVAVRVLLPGGFSEAKLSPSATLNNNGSLAERVSEGEAPPPRSAFQDFSGSASSQLHLVRGSTTVDVVGNLLAASVRQQSLRFGLLGGDAPRIDLSDFAVRVSAGGAQWALGNVQLAGHRYLSASFASRGVTARLGRGPVTLDLATTNGSPIVGWSNLSGLRDADHRVRSAVLGVELIPHRPGALRLDLSSLGTALRPVAGFTREALVDAEQSLGDGMQLAASTPGQRVHLVAGYARSRFDNPADRRLGVDTAIVPVERVRRAARFGELSLNVLQNRLVRPSLPVSLSTTWRYERLDPLYRSLAPLQADRDQLGADINASAGAVAVAAQYTRMYDNLANMPSALRTMNRTLNGNASVATQQLPGLKRLGVLAPMLVLTATRTHAMATNQPTNVNFRPQDFPDQVSLNADVSATWQANRWRSGIRLNRSHQDNRQVTRENADITSRVVGPTLAVTITPKWDVALDGGIETQESHEQHQRNRLQRLATTSNWRPFSMTALSLTSTLSRGRDLPRTQKNTMRDLRIELSQGVKLAHTAGERGRLFVRYYALSQRTRRFLDAAVSNSDRAAQRWNVTSGFSLRLW